MVEDYRSYLQRFESSSVPVTSASTPSTAGASSRSCATTSRGEVQGVPRGQKAYGEILERGDTINDVLVKVRASARRAHARAPD